MSSKGKIICPHLVELSSKFSRRDAKGEELVNVIASWAGSDARWYHRPGGFADGDEWIDNFNTTNPALPICAIALEEDLIVLDPGNYKIQWVATLKYQEPVCQSPSESYLAMACAVRDLETGYSRESQILEFTACNRRNGPYYNWGITSYFRVTERQEKLDLSFYAFSDSDSGRTGDANCIEAKLYRMRLTTFE